MTRYTEIHDMIVELRERIEALEKYVRWTGPRCTYAPGDGPYCSNPAEYSGNHFDYRCGEHR